MGKSRLLDCIDLDIRQMAGCANMLKQSATGSWQ